MGFGPRRVHSIQSTTHGSDPLMPAVLTSWQRQRKTKKVKMVRKVTVRLKKKKGKNT